MALAGRRILIVEDEAIIALAIEDMLAELQCQTVGPAMTLLAAEALARTEALDAGVLDLNLGGDSSQSVAEILRERGIPFCFSTGYGSADIPQGFIETPLLQKPYAADDLGGLLAQLISKA